MFDSVPPHRLCIPYLQSPEVRSDMLSGFTSHKRATVLPRRLVFQSLLLSLLAAYFLQISIWFHFWTLSVSFSLAVTFLFYLLSIQLPRFLTEPCLGHEAWQRLSSCVDSLCLSLSQKEEESLVGPMIVSCHKSLYPEHRVSVLLGYILTLSLYLDLDPLKQLHALFKVLLLHLSALWVSQHKAEGRKW